MNVIGHDDPRPQFVSCAMEHPQRRLNNNSDFRAAQMALAVPLVQVRLQLCPTLAIILDPPEMFPLGAKSSWKAIGEAEGDKLRQTGFVTMRQATGLMPAAKAEHRMLAPWRRSMATLVRHQFAHARIVWQPRTAGLGWLAHVGY